MSIDLIPQTVCTEAISFEIIGRTMYQAVATDSTPLDREGPSHSALDVVPLECLGRDGWVES